MKASNRSSDFLYMASGFVEAIKALGVMVLLREFWGEYFGVLSFNVDLIVAFSGLLAPWSVLYLQSSKSNSNAYADTFSTLVPMAVMVGGVYFASSVFFVFEQILSGSYEVLRFLLFRMLSFVVISCSLINFLVLMRNGRGGQVFILQVFSMCLILAIYYIFSRKVLSLDLVFVGLGLLLVELLVFVVAHRMARHLGGYLSKCIYFDISFVKRLEAQRLILLPELGSVVVVVLSGLFMSVAVFFALKFEYHLYRLPFAFMTASWVISNKAMLLVISFLSEHAKGGLLSSVWGVFKNTWYVPCILYLFAYVWIVGSSQNDKSTILGQIFVGLAYYPTMVMCIALSAWLRVENKNSILLKANAVMLFCYFAPLAILIVSGLLSPLYALHVVGVSYVVKVFVILLLSGANCHEYCRIFK